MTALTPELVLESLRRSDKWFLGAGGPLIWAPPFPQYLDRPGFWDRAHYFGFALAPLFSIALLDRAGAEIPLRAAGQTWRPDVLQTRYRSDLGLVLTEERSVSRPGALVSTLRFEHVPTVARLAAVVAWSAQPAPVERRDNQHLVARRLEHPRVPPFDVFLALGMRPGAESLAAQASEPVTLLPKWQQTPFVNWRPGSGDWNGGAAQAPDGSSPLIFFAQRLELPPDGPATWPIRIAMAASSGLEQALGRLDYALSGDAVADSHHAWTAFLSRVPRFTCSDAHLERAYWYRWYMLFLNSVDAAEGAYRHPFVCEGIDYFRAPITYSAQAILRDVRWLDTPRLGQGLVRTFMDHQRDDGSLPGHVFASGVRPESFYHSGWGEALRALHQVHPDRAFVREIYSAFERYAEFLRRERDPDDSGLVEIWNQFESGQEYSPRYAFAQPDAGDAEWGQGFRLKGVDVTVYAYQLFRWLADFAPTSEQAERWNRLAARSAAALQERCWDAERGFFVDVLPGSSARSPVRAATGFYPFATDLVSHEHLRALHDSMLDPRSFWTEHPLPTVSLDDSLFSAEGVWRDVRRNCPWNGRSWPMVNSHAIEALVRSGERLDSSLLPHAAELLRRFVRTLFWEGDSARPNAFEHYDPHSGAPSAYRGIDDYVHSWLVDLVIQYVCGLRPEHLDALVLRPLPLDLEWFELEDAPLRGRRVSVRWRRSSGLRLYVNGLLRAEGADLEPVTVPLDG